MDKFISIIIPNFNGSSTIGKCLEAALASPYSNFEVMVVDDCSTDESVRIIEQFPCRLIRLDRHSGAAVARNKGAENSNGEILFFTDADCLIREDALSLANKALADQRNDVIGGTYTPLPHDTDFFSTFQSIFIHYSETKKKEPDYIAGHALVIEAALFKASGGFPENPLPIPEDVKFSHQLRRSGCRLIMVPEIQVSHVFNFTLFKSLRNAYRKSMFWTIYSLSNKDLLSDSGTASRELKATIVCFFLNILLAALSLILHDPMYLLPLPVVFICALFYSRKLLTSFFIAKGFFFFVRAALYYAGVYPAAVGAGVFAGMVRYAVARRATE